MPQPFFDKPARRRRRLPLKRAVGWTAVGFALVLAGLSVWNLRYRWVGYWGNGAWGAAAEVRTGQFVLILQQPAEVGSVAVVYSDTARFQWWEWVYDQTTVGKSARKGTVAVVTLWPVAIVSPAIGIAVLRADRRERRRSAQQCRACGYSRAGLAVGAACPECGVA